jgi:hypothetical protein
VTLSISTTPHTAVVIRGVLPPMLLLARIGIGIVLIGFWFHATMGWVRRLAPRLVLACLLTTAAGLASCAEVGGGKSFPPLVNPATGTPAQTYHFSVNATSGGVSHSTNITLTVM